MEPAISNDKDSTF